jgi:predicted nucleotidyltransferase
MNHHANIVRIKAVNRALSGLKEEFVFVGGAVVSLYADRIAEEVRPTEDIDVLVEIYSRWDYTLLEDRLRELGFRNDTTSGFVGRFIIEKLIVDFMPLEEKILGFSNRWYAQGFNNAITIPLDDHNTIKIFTAPYFLATKFEAFKNRGKNKGGEADGRFSTDFEDIIFVLANRIAIWQEMKDADKDVRNYLKVEFAALLDNIYFEEWIDSHTGYSSPAAQAIILPLTRRFVSSK